MNFSRNEEEELRKLKQRIQQQDVRLSMLQVEKQKEESQRAVLSKELNDVRQKCNAQESKFVHMEDEYAKVKEDRDRQRMASTNLQQALNAAQSQLQDREKDKRLFSADTDREHQRLLRASEDEVEKLSAKCKQLEQQVRSQKSSQAFDGRGLGGRYGLDAKMATLEDENAALKANLLRYESSAKTSDSSSVSAGRSRRPRSSSVNGGSSMEAYQLNESLNEANARAEKLEARAIKAEREALKTSNELIATSRRNAGIIKDLETKLADMSDELDFQRDNVVKKLERDVEELQSQCSRMVQLEQDIQIAQIECSSLRAQLDSSAETIKTQKRSASDAAAQLTANIEEKSMLQSKLIVAEACATRLEQKEKEVESARNRIRKLSNNLRKTLGGLTNGASSTGDETTMSVLGAAPDESAIFNTTAMTNLREYSTDMLDELEQLLCFVDEADGRAEFAKVENRIQSQNAVEEREGLMKQISAANSELEVLKDAAGKTKEELHGQQNLIETLQAAKRDLEEAVETGRANVDSVLGEKQDALTSLATLQEDLVVAKSEMQRGNDERSGLLEKIEGLEKTCSQREEQLGELESKLQGIAQEKSALQNQIEEARGRIQSLEEQGREEREYSEELLGHKHSLEAEKRAVEAKLTEAEAELVKHEETQHIAELEGAKLALNVHQLQEQLRDTQALASEREISLITKGLDDLRFEQQQWQSLVEDLKLEMSTKAISQAKKEQKMHRVDQNRLDQIDSLQAEVDKVGSTLAERMNDVQRLHLDLQASRANQQLAEDALSKLLPNTRETDVTVLGDVSSMDTAQNHSTESEDTMQVWRDRVKSSEEIAESARDDALRWRGESERLEVEVKRLTEAISEYVTEVDTLKSKLHQAEEAASIAHTSMETMQDELNTRIQSMQKMQMTLQTSEGAMLDLRRENELLEERMAEAKKEQLVTKESISASKSLVAMLSDELRDSQKESSVLKTEMDALVYGLSALRDQLKEAHAARGESEARANDLEQLFIANQQAHEARGEELSQREAALHQRSEVERSQHSGQISSLAEELEEAREAFTSLKQQMEIRNAEYWETKEELAEWQERYERSQADVKIKDELDERLREAHAELDDAQARAEAMQARCTALEQDLVSVRGQKEDMLSRMSAQDEEMQRGKQLAAELAEAQMRLADTDAHIERLELDLTQKAQECEDADDKELALRKDNKRLAARLATLQARVEKLQESAASAAAAASISTSAQTTTVVVKSVTDSAATSGAPANNVPVVRSIADNNDASAAVSGSRKRRAPDDEEVAKQTESERGLPTLTRAVYAPKPSAVQAAIRPTVSATIAPTSANARTSSTGTGMTASNSGGNIVKKASHSPSDLIAKRLRSPKKESLQDRTNLLQPRLAASSQNGQTGPGGNPFMAKLNRYRAPAVPLLNPNE